MNELEIHLKKIETKIAQSQSKIKREITVLQKLVKQQSMNLDMFKEQYKGKTYHVASVILDEVASEIKDKHKTYNNLTNRNVVDKNFVEKMGLIQPPLRMKVKHKTLNVKKSNLLAVGNMNAKIRKINDGNNMSEGEKQIMKTLLQEMAKELE